MKYAYGEIVETRRLIFHDAKRRLFQWYFNRISIIFQPYFN
jgi:hypothetical protein